MSEVGIVTGAARGMGLACAARLCETVDELLLADIDGKAAAEAAEALARDGEGARLEPFALDVTDGPGIGRLAARVGELGRLRSVVHAAGISPSMADWRRVLTVDLVGTARLLDALQPLAGAGAAFVCFSSMAPLLGETDWDPRADAAIDDPLAPDFLERLRAALGTAIEDSGAAYTWAKRGVHRLVRREAVRFGRAGARVCSLSPGIIDTPMGQLEFQNHPIKLQLVKGSPFGRVGRPEEVAAAVQFLLSDEAGFVNGTDLLVDGGLCASVSAASSS